MPKRADLVTITIRMPPMLRKQVNDAAHYRRISTNQLCVELLEEFVRQRQDPQSKDKGPALR